MWYLLQYTKYILLMECNHVGPNLTCFLDFSVVVASFAIGLRQISSLFSCINVALQVLLLYKQKRSTEGCPKLKSPETRQVQERLVSLEQMQVPNGTGPGVWRSKRPSVLHAAPVAYVLWKPYTIRQKVKNWWNVLLLEGVTVCIWSSSRMSFNIRERETSYCLVRCLYRP